jgi:hypothetical protein
MAQNKGEVIGTRFDAGTTKRLRIRAAAIQGSVSQVIRLAVQEHLNQTRKDSK